MTSNKIAIIVGGIVLMAAFGSCSDSSPPSSSATTVFVPSTELATTPSDDFLTMIHAESSSVSSAAGGDANLILLGEATCTDWTRGADATEVVADAIRGLDSQTTTSVSAHQMGEIMGAATATLCPAYGPQFQAWAAANR